MTTVHSADPPRRFQELARELDVAAAARAARRDARARGRRALATAREPDDGATSPDVADLLGAAGALPEHESALVLERLGVPFAPRRRAATPEEAAARGGGARSAGRRQARRSRAQGHETEASSSVSASPEDAAEAARRLRRPGARRHAGRGRRRGALRHDPRSASSARSSRSGGAAVDVEELDRVALSSAPLDRARRGELVAEAGVDDPHGVVARRSSRWAISALAHPRDRVESTSTR